MNLRELKRLAGITPFDRRIELVNDFAACPFHHGDSEESFHVVAARDGAIIGTCFSECGKSWNALDFVRDFDKVPIGEAIRRVTAELAFSADQKIRVKKKVTPMTLEKWKTWGRAVGLHDVVRLAASRPHSATPSVDTLNALGFKMSPADFLSCAYRLGDTFYTVKGRRISDKYFLQENAVSQRGLFNIDAVTAGCGVYVVESELDAAVLHEHGYIAVSVISATQRLIEPEVLEKLLTARRVFLVGDSDEAGVLCMDAIAKLLPSEKVYRVPLVGVKDVGELYQQHPSDFENRLKTLLHRVPETVEIQTR